MHFQLLIPIASSLFASFSFVAGRDISGGRHRSGFNELNTEGGPFDENEQGLVTEVPTRSPTSKLAATVLPSSSPTTSPIPTYSPTVFVAEASEDTEDIRGGGPGPTSIDGDNGLSPNGIIAIALGSGFVILAAIVFRRRQWLQEEEAAAAAAAAAAADEGNATTDPGDTSPL